MTVVGLGNVALDCARVLLKVRTQKQTDLFNLCVNISCSKFSKFLQIRQHTQSPDELAKTDLATHALETLRKSSVKHVHLVGRRGVLQVCLTQSCQICEIH